ncbi:MAG: NAD(+) diphosphatase [Erysipelotrichaceae bacterium]|nr:NAD(+) diphosphatase [Erysipelotrichaceae bacterium]
MIQDLYPHVYHNEYHPHDPELNDIVLFYDEKMLYCQSPERFFTVGEVSGQQLTYLFSIDEVSYYLGSVIPENSYPVSSADIRTMTAIEYRFAAITGRQLANWYHDHRFCGVCGHPMQHHQIERALECTHCGKIVYPTIMPAVIVGVLNEKDQLLVTQYAGRRQNHYALVAGFAEIGETIEETVRREVKEETGLDVSDITYFKCQPWSFSDTLLFGFWCKADSSQPVVPDEQELKLAKWVSREELENPDDSISLTSHMIRMFCKGEKHYGS